MAAWIVLALWMGCADSSPNPETLPTVHVRIDQDARFPAHVLRIIIEEVEKIWGPAGVRVTAGRFADPVPAGRAIVSMRIVAVEAPQGHRRVLGWVNANVYEQETPTIFISRSGLKDLLATALFSGLSLNFQPIALRDRLTAQAMGRVASHELGHYFLRSRQHHDQGLMRPVYSTVDLMAPWLTRFQIPEKDRVALRCEVARLAEAQKRPIAGR